MTMSATDQQAAKRRQTRMDPVAMAETLRPETG